MQLYLREIIFTTTNEHSGKYYICIKSNVAMPRKKPSLYIKMAHWSCGSGGKLVFSELELSIFTKTKYQFILAVNGIISIYRKYFLTFSRMEIILLPKTIFSIFTRNIETCL